MLQAALDYLALGFAVFPLRPGEKIPLGSLVPNGVKDASRDPDTIRRWWAQAPLANVGVALGEASGVCCIDLDDGATEEHLKLFPRTATAKTRDGYHLYFALPAQGIKNGEFDLSNASDRAISAAKTNVRATHYYVVGVGSVVNGWEYTWHSDLGGELCPPEAKFAEIPNWLLGAKSLTAPAASPVTPAGAVAGGDKSGSGGARKNAGRPKLATEGSRHEKLLKVAVGMRKNKKSDAEIHTEIARINSERLDAPKPKEECDAIVDWVMKNIEPAIALADAYILPLGHDGSDYMYTTSSNRQIVMLSRSGHNSAGLLDLMPIQYWQQRFSKGENGQVDWLQAASDLMEGCREAGIFTYRKVRGVGCWREDGGDELVVHLGDRIYRRQKYEPLSSPDSKFIYALSPRLPDIHSDPLRVEECAALIEAVECLHWKDPASAILFAGGLALLRICGALPWRPMLWLTGPSGSGKSTVLNYVVENIAGKFCVKAQGATTEAGLRQEIGCDALPVVFDEAEANNQRTSARMQNILELVRQSSSDTDRRILKGTPTGRGHNFKINSAFLLSSIRVCLEEEADVNRFCVLELLRNEADQWPAVSAKLSRMTPEYGERLFSRMVARYSLLTQNKLVLEEMVAAQSDMRTGQQLGILLAAYWMLKSDAAIDPAQAQALVARVTVPGQHRQKEQEQDEFECLDWLLESRAVLRVCGEVTSERIKSVVVKAQVPGDYLDALRDIGMDFDSKHSCLVIRGSHPELVKIFQNTKWGKNWNNSLQRYPGAFKNVHRFQIGGQKRCVSIPIQKILSDT